MTHAEKCTRAAVIVRQHGAIELFDLDHGDTGIFGPELGDVLAAAADQTGPLAEAARLLAEAILFAADEPQEGT